jgi:hypothetical protein
VETTNNPEVRRILSCEAGNNRAVFQAGFLLDLFFNPENEGDIFLRNVGSFNRLCYVISQKTELFRTIVLKTSNPTNQR